MSSSQREIHLGDMLRNVDIYRREEESLRDSDGGPSRSDELREATEGQEPKLRVRTPSLILQTFTVCLLCQAPR